MGGMPMFGKLCFIAARSTCRFQHQREQSNRTIPYPV